jgi:hypothetical protein
VLIPLGSIALAGGSFLAVISGLSPTPVDETARPSGALPPNESSGPSSTALVGLTFMGVGALTLTSGIIMTVVGGKKVPVRTTEALAPAPRWTVKPLVGMGSAGVMGTF